MNKLLLSSSIKDTFKSASLLAKKFNFGIEISRLPYYDYPLLSSDEISERIKKELIDFDGRITVHALFSDLNPGTYDDDLLKITDRRYKYSFDIAKKIGADTVLFHSGNKGMKHYGSQNKYIRNSVKYWKEFIKYFEDNNMTAVIENVHERTPNPCLEIVEKVASPNLNLALDIGHANLFSEVPLTDWIKTYQEHLVHMHIHNNFGKNDDHFPLTNGNINLIEIFNVIKDLGISPTIVFEMFEEEYLVESLKYYNEYLR